MPSVRRFVPPTVSGNDDIRAVAIIAVIVGVVIGALAMLIVSKKPKST